MNRNIMIFMDYKIHKFNHLVEQIKDDFGTSQVKVSRKNYILSQYNDNIIFDVTPKHIKCMISENGFSEDVDKINKFIEKNFRNEIVGIRYSDNTDDFIQPNNVRLVKI